MSVKYEDVFYQALRIRMVEEKIAAIYPSDKIQSPVHLSIGQEHHIAALVSQLEKNDQVFTSYRSHAAYLAKGGDLRKMFAELYGKATGISKGKAGSMHLSSPETNMMGSSGIVAATLPHALGAAYAFSLLKKDSIAASITGDGSTEEGVFHECLNFSSLKKLPALFVIENNGLAVHSRQKVRQSFDLEKLAGAFGIKYFRSDKGYDMQEVSSRSKEIMSLVRRASAPAVYEIITYRYMPHVGINNDYENGYRARTELAQWEENDPLINDKELISRFKTKIEEEIREAVDYAEKSRFPDRSELTKECY
jgi:pyruvate dehydrogenase E1 component alpha subunit